MRDVEFHIHISDGPGKTAHILGKVGDTRGRGIYGLYIQRPEVQPALVSAATVCHFKRPISVGALAVEGRKCLCRLKCSRKRRTS